MVASFASVGQALARTIASLPWTLFTSLLTHRLVLLCIDAHCFIFWELPGGVLAAPESALCGWIGVILLSLSLTDSHTRTHPSQTLRAAAGAGGSGPPPVPPLFLLCAPPACRPPLHAPREAAAAQDRARAQRPGRAPSRPGGAGHGAEGPEGQGGAQAGWRRAGRGGSTGACCGAGPGAGVAVGSHAGCPAVLAGRCCQAGGGHRGQAHVFFLCPARRRECCSGGQRQPGIHAAHGRAAEACHAA